VRLAWRLRAAVELVITGTFSSVLSHTALFVASVLTVIRRAEVMLSARVMVPGTWRTMSGFSTRARGPRVTSEREPFCPIVSE
jgi:hypothetical protein